MMLRSCTGAKRNRLPPHARKAWLKGLSPKENRTVPPLDYDRVVRLKAAWPDRFVGVNGGIETVEDALALAGRLDGVMLGRAVYHRPMLLDAIDAALHGGDRASPLPEAIAAAYRPYMAAELARGTRLNHLTRHMLGLFHGRRGARRWRQILASRSVEAGAGLEVLDEALAAVAAPAGLAAAV